MSDTKELSLGELVSRLSEQTSQLVRDEIRLAQAEVKEKGKHAGLGLGLFSGAGLIALFALGALVTTAILALALVLPAWAAAAVVTGALLVIAGIAALVGKSQVSKATGPPEKSVTSVKRDVNELKEHAHR